MVDIHTHLLFDVDDGADSLEESVAMLREAKAQGITAIILTPHYRHGMFAYNNERIAQNYSILKKYAAEIGIRISLGTEYHVNSRMVEYLREGRCLTLAGSQYVLAEYSYEAEYSYIRQMNEELLHQGYVPVVAHVERCRCLVKKPESVRELRGMGAMIQVNCDAVLGRDGRGAKKFAKRLLQEGCIDVIASDSHGIKERSCHMSDCFFYVSKKFGEKTARRLMQENPQMIFDAN